MQQLQVEHEAELVVEEAIGYAHGAQAEAAQAATQAAVMVFCCHAGSHMARVYSGEEVATICADLQRIFQATIDEVREEAAENVNDA